MQISNSSITANFSQSSAGISQASERIASGSRINTAADDAAGSAISNRFSAQIRSLTQATQNANDGISYLQSSSASYSSVTEGIERVRELALQAANGTLQDSDRQAINAEAQQVLEEITQTVGNSQFNGKSLFGNTDPIDLQVGAEASDTLSVQLDDFSQTLSESGFDDIDLSTAGGASNALAALDQVQQGVDSASATIGAGINRLESTISSLSNSTISAEASRSRTQDADLAKEISNLVQEKIKQEAGIALQAQANQNAGSVLNLLQ